MRLSENEEKIMAVIWDANHPITLPQIRNKLLNQHEDISPDIIMQVIGNLQDKGYTAVDIAEYYCCYPLVDKADYVRTVFKELINRFYNTDTDEMICDLRKSDNTVPDEESAVAARKMAAEQFLHEQLRKKLEQ